MPRPATRAVVQRAGQAVARLARMLEAEARVGVRVVAPEAPQPPLRREAPARLWVEVPEVAPEWQRQQPVRQREQAPAVPQQRQPALLWVGVREVEVALQRELRLEAPAALGLRWWCPTHRRHHSRSR